MYIESVKAARKFMSAARAAARNKPVLLVKAGRAPEGAKAAASHTGALAGSDAVFDAAARRAGMLRVDTLEALFDAAQTLAHARPWRGDALALLTNGGGAGVLAADALSLAGGTLAVLRPETLRALDGCLPATWSHGNPVDIIGDAPVQRYADALKVLLAAQEVDSLLFMHAPTAIVAADDIAAACLPLLAATPKPAFTCWLGGPAVVPARVACAAAGIAGYTTPERAAAAWMQVVNYARNQRMLQQIPPAALPELCPDRAAARTLHDEAHSAGREWLGDAASQALLQAYGIPAVATMRVVDADAAVDAADAIGYPVALKIVSPQVIHKSDVGGVALGLACAEDVRGAATAMQQRVRDKLPHAMLAGFTVQAMAQRRGAHELIVGLSTDPVFGPVLLLGEGGTQVEIRKNHAVTLPPLNGSLAADLLDRSGLLPLLAGYRGRPPADMDALQQVLLKVSQLACDLPWLAELDINPLLVDEHGVLAVDSRVRLHPAAEARTDRLAIRPYPADLEEYVQVAGSGMLLRPIRPDDGHRLMDFYAAASPEDMRLRFFMARREVPRSELARYSQIDYDREMTFIALAPADETGSHAMAGVVRAVCDPDNLQAEFDIQVAARWQRQGLGRLLLDKMVHYLRQRGTAEVVGRCMAENTGMSTLAQQAGFAVRPDPDGVGLRLPLR
jgi:acetyltransferase